MRKLTDDKKNLSGKICDTRRVSLLISLSRPRSAPKQQFVTFYPAEAHASPSRFPDSRTTGRCNWFRKDKCASTYNDRRGLAIIQRETTWSLLDFR